MTQVMHTGPASPKVLNLLLSCYLTRIMHTGLLSPKVLDLLSSMLPILA